jgi:hypothetical protein
MPLNSQQASSKDVISWLLASLLASWMQASLSCRAVIDEMLLSVSAEHSFCGFEKDS